MSLTDLYPRGGGFIKNSIASAMVRYGASKFKAKDDWDFVDRRVPPGGDHYNYNDSFVFQGSDDQGNMFMSRIGLREDGSSREIWVFFDVDGKKFVNSPILLTGENPEDHTISGGGLSYIHNKSDKTWMIKFKGVLTDGVKCEADLRFKPLSKPYLSSLHMDPASTGRAMAEMSWSKEYFRQLSSERQVRMEQGGLLEGDITIGDKTRFISFKGLRDHSFGKRKWTFINRYIWNILSLNEPIDIGGDPYDYLCYTTVDYGNTFKHLVSGWIAGPDNILPIVASSNMHDLANDGVIPGQYDITFVPKGNKPVSGTVFRSGIPHAWMLQNNGFEVNEAYCTVDIEGKKGQGMSEFGFLRE